MMKKFASKKGISLKVTILLVALMIISYILNIDINGNHDILSYSILLFCIVVFFYLIWVLFFTHYVIDKEKLIYKSGFFTGSIEISSVHKIEVSKTLWGGLKPATAFNGLIIHYNKYDVIYISPVSNELLLEKILEVNPKIAII